MGDPLRSAERLVCVPLPIPFGTLSSAITRSSRPLGSRSPVPSGAYTCTPSMPSPPKPVPHQMLPSGRMAHGSLIQGREDADVGLLAAVVLHVEGIDLGLLGEVGRRRIADTEGMSVSIC